MLKPYFGVSWKATKENTIKDAKEYEARQMLVLARQSRLRKDVMKTFPKEIDATLWMSNGGTTFITAIIELPKDAPIKHTILAKRYLTARYHKAERTFDSYGGNFTWQGLTETKDRKGKYQEKIRIQNTDPGTCKIIQYKETVTKYKTDCKGNENV